MQMPLSIKVSSDQVLHDSQDSPVRIFQGDTVVI